MGLRVSYQKEPAPRNSPRRHHIAQDFMQYNDASVYVYIRQHESLKMTRTTSQTFVYQNRRIKCLTNDRCSRQHIFEHFLSDHDIVAAPSTRKVASRTCPNNRQQSDSISPYLTVPNRQVRIIYGLYSRAYSREPWHHQETPILSNHHAIQALALTLALPTWKSCE